MSQGREYHTSWKNKQRRETAQVNKKVAEQLASAPPDSRTTLLLATRASSVSLLRYSYRRGMSKPRLEEIWGRQLVSIALPLEEAGSEYGQS